MARTKPWTVSEEFWEKVQPLIPAAPSHARGGRPRISERTRRSRGDDLRTTSHRHPRERAAKRAGSQSSTVHERFPRSGRWKASSGNGKTEAG